MNLLTRIGKFLRPTLTTIQSKQHCSFILSCELEHSQTICGLCIISSTCSNFNCCSTPSSKWQRQHLLFKCTILVSLMSQLWVSMNTLYKCREVCCSYVNYLWLSVAKFIQSCTILRYFCMAMYGSCSSINYKWDFLFVLSHLTSVLHRIVQKIRAFIL